MEKNQDNVRFSVKNTIQLGSSAGMLRKKEPMNKRILGTILVTSSLLIGLIDRFSHIVSSYFNQLLYGDLYLHPVDGILSDASCGFNADMHFVALLFLVLITGIVLIIIPLVQRDVH